MIESTPYAETDEQNAAGKFEVGGLQLLKHGDRIPVRLNPLMSVAGSHSPKLVGRQLAAYPNPCDEYTVITFDNPLGVPLRLEAINLLGVVCSNLSTPAICGMQQMSVDMTALPAGSYILRLSNPVDGWSATTLLAKTGAAESPWSLNLREAAGR